MWWEPFLKYYVHIFNVHFSIQHLSLLSSVYSMSVSVLCLFIIYFYSKMDTVLWLVVAINTILVISFSGISCASDFYGYDHVISIDPTLGNDTDECIHGEVPCKTLGWVFSGKHRRNSTMYVLEEGSHILDSSTETFEGLSSLVFVGNSSKPQDVVINCTEENTGLAFQEVADIRFKTLTFFNCSAVRNSTSRKYNDADPDGFELYQTRVGLYFYLCSGVEMVRVIVSHSPKATGVIMYNTDGTNLIQNSTFDHNRLSNGESELPGGGGFYVEFTYCVPGNKTCSYKNYSDLPDVITQHNSNSTYTFDSCTFSNNFASNIAANIPGTSYIIPNKQTHQAFGQGGGLSIMTKGNASGNNFTVSECTFQHNRAIWGGGLLTSFIDVSLNNSLLVTHTVFHNNSCLSRSEHRNGSSGTGGGGMRIGQNVFNSKSYNLNGNQVLIRQCNFTMNQAVSGGGLSISPAKQFYGYYKELTTVNISRSLFRENTAMTGAALEVTLFPFTVRGGLPRLYISNSQFVKNRLFHHGENVTTAETGVGAVYSNGVALNFKGEVLFERNFGSALAVVGMRVSFEGCVAEFFGNHGSSGGAIILLGVTYILVDNFTEMTFINNTAEVFGGAISNTYIERENLVTNPNCFVRHYDPFLHPDEWGATFCFEDNRGSLLDDTIYTTSIFPCAWPGWGNSTNVLCGKNWTYHRSASNERKNCNSEIKTDTGNIELTSKQGDCVSKPMTSDVYLPGENHHQVDSSHSSMFGYHSLSEAQPLLRAIPGKPFQLPLEVSDDFHYNTTSTTVFAVRSLNSSVSQVDPRFVYTSGGYMQLNGISNNTVSLHLDTISPRTWHIELQVELLDCPPGFMLSDDPPRRSSKCKCNPLNYQKKLRCDQSDFQSLLQNGYWMGTTPESNGSLVVSLCLPGFCNKNTTADYFLLPPDISEISTTVCQDRKGILCGECIPGYGPAVNRPNYQCVRCNGTNNAAHMTYYVLAVYAPLLLLFTGIIVFNVRLTTGPANAFIFYSQIIASTFDLTGDDHIPLNLISNHSSIFLATYRIPYGIFNLDFLENFVRPLCLGIGLNALDALQLDYVVATFPLIMILLVLVVLKVKTYGKSLCHGFLQQYRQPLHNYTSEAESSPVVEHSRVRSARTCQWFHDWQAGESLLHAFSAFLLLSYTKFALTSSYIVNLHPTLGANGSQIGPRRAYYAGGFTEHDPMYLWRYYVPSCCIIVIIAIIPLMLLGYPIIWLEKCINNVEWLWRWYPVTKIHIFMDTFQGCYRDDRRFFAAMYFLFRLCINVGYILTDTWLQQFVVQQIACTTFIVLFVLCWPYRDEKWLFNYVDFLMLVNLAFVNALSLYLFAFAQTNHGLPLPKSAFVVQYILVFLPLIYMVLFVNWYMLKPSQKERISRFFNRCWKVKCSSRRHRAVYHVSTPYYVPSSVAVNTTTYNNCSDTTQHGSTARPTVITATDLEFIEDDSEHFSGSDEDEAILSRARGRNRYKPPKKKSGSTHGNNNNKYQQRYINGELKKNDLEDMGQQVPLMRDGGVNGHEVDRSRGALELLEEEEGRGSNSPGVVQKQSEVSSGCLSGGTGGILVVTDTGSSASVTSSCVAGASELCASEKQELCSSSSSSSSSSGLQSSWQKRDYGTMYRIIN